MNLRELVSLNIKNARLRSGLSQAQLGERIGMSIRYISILENNAQNVTLETLEAITRGLGISPIDLLGAGDEADPVSIRKAKVDFDKAMALLSRYRTIMDRQVKPPRRVRTGK